MKKILSTLVMCLILGVGYSYGITVTAKAVVYDQTKSNSERVQGGGNVVVYVSNKYERVWFSYSWSSWNDGTPNGNDTYSTWTGDPMSGGNKDGKVCYSASVENTSNGYVFYQWQETDGSQITEKSSRDRDIKDTEISADKTVYAVFKPVTVDLANNGTISVTDITPATKEGTVTFNVTGADHTNDFDEPIVEGEGFVYKSMSYDKNVITVTVTYTVQDKDNVNGDPKRPHSATVTLRSKGDADGTQTKQATITATESLIPAFTLPAHFDVTPDAPALTTAPAQQSFTIMTNNQVAANASWDATLPQEAKELGFSVETSATTVTVKFTPKNNDYEEDLTATLSITGSYKDSNGKIITNTQSVSLSADKGSAVKIDGTTTASYDFGTKEYTGQAYTHDLTYASNISNGLTYSWGNNKFTHIVNGSTIKITLPGTSIPGDYSDKLSVKYGDTEVASLATSAKVRLAQPQIESKGYMSQVLLTWKNVYGAKQYILKSGETVIDISDVMTSEAIATASTTASHTISYSKMITAIGGIPLKTGTEYSITLTVVYGDDVNNINDATKISSATIKATPTATTTITAADVPLLGIYTGTEKPGAYPYHKDGKRLVDLSSAFNDGKAIFNQLFIFGLTSGDASNNITLPTQTTNSNAVTPCYIYNKSGNNYVLSKTIDNVNITTKPTEFNISTTAGNKIYLTGYAPFASCGTTWEENAVFLFTGQETVDIYLDNLELYARSKAVTGVGLKVLPTKNFTVNTSNLGSMLFDPDIKLSISPLQATVFTQGSGAAFAFTTTSTSSSTKYQPTIHLRGYNVLESTSGCNIFVDVDIAGKKMQMSAQQHSSPIQIQVNKTGHANKCETELTLDDIWVGTAERTNGYLNLANRNVRLAPTIDLGDEYSTLTFNGGQYYLSNAANDPNLDQLFTVSYAISYRLKSMYDGLAVMYGLGDDQPGAKVRFKDGSFTCAELPETHFQEKLYHNRFSMKCPFDTKVDGGTFNSDVLVCSATDSKGGSPTNSTGAALCKVPIPVVSTTAKGLAVLPTGWMNLAVKNGAKTDTLGYYGIKSLAPATIYRESGEVMYEKGVNMLLPSDQICFLEMVRVPTVFCNPKISTSAAMATIERGGNLTVPYTYTAGSGEEMTKVQLTSRFVYTEVDDYLRNANKDGYQTPLGTNLTIADDANAYVSNTDKYVIKDKIYWIRPIVANEWKMVVPPFDVSNVYVIETYPEAKILADYGDGKKITGDQIYNARIAQAKRMLNFMFYWLYDDERAYDSDLWSKINSTPYSPFVAEWVNFETKTDDADPSNDQLAYTPSIQQLYHFTGSNWDANYYLYESDGEWEYSAEEGFITDWKLVTTQSMPRTSGTPKTIMKKGGIYAMSFPYTVGKHDPDAAWDYWTGKYIIMEGYPTEYVDEVIGDAQVLSGTTTDWNNQPLSFTVFADYSGDGASLRGNQTFGQLTLQKTNDFFLKSDNTFEPFNGSKSINPGEGFLLANISAPSGMPQRRIASIDIKSGAVTYEEGEDSPTTSVTAPTIAGDRTIVVYTIPNGLGVIPIVPQYVSIYNTAGQLVISQYISGETQFDLPSGIYLVSGETDRAKAMVK